MQEHSAAQSYPGQPAPKAHPAQTAQTAQTAPKKPLPQPPQGARWWTRFWSLLFKDFKEQSRNQTVWIMLLSPVLIFSLMQRTLDKGDLKPVAVSVVAPADSGLLRVLQTNELLKVSTETELQAKEKLRHREVVALLTIPPGFEKSVSAGEFPILNLVGDDSKVRSLSIFREVLRSACRELANQDFPVDVRVQHADDFAQKGSQEVSRAQLCCLWMLLGCLSALNMAASSLAEEKEAGCLRQMLLTPATRPQFLSAKLVACAVLSTLSGLIVLKFSGLVGPNWGSASALLFLGSLAFASIGALIGVLTPGSVSSNAWSGAVFLVLLLPVTLRETSQSMSQLSKFSPAHYIQEGMVRAVLGSVADRSEMVSLIILAGFTFAVFTISCVYLGRWLRA